MIITFYVMVILLLMLLCLLVRRTNESLFFIYELLKDMKRTEEGTFNHVKHIKEKVDGKVL